MKRKLILLLLCTVQGFIALSQTKTTTSDQRDKQVYPFITFENIQGGDKPITWMAKDLNFKLGSGSWQSPDKEFWSKEQGLLYTWEGAMKACPVGWHLPSEAEWQALVDTFGGNSSAGQSLKSGDGWANNGSGQNLSSFNARPSVYRADGEFSFSYNSFGYWWTSTPVNDAEANVFQMNFGSNGVTRQTEKKENGYAVRCIKD